MAAFSDGSTPTPEPTPSEGLISNSSDVTAGTYAIVFQHGSNGKYYYLPNDPVIAKNPAGVEVTVTDGKLASPATDDMKWTLTGDNAAGFVVSGNGHYLTSTNTAQGIAVTDTESTQTWNFKDDADNGMLMQSAAVTDARFLSVYLAANGTTATWRYYNVGSSYQGKLYLIAVDGGTSGGDTPGGDTPGDGKTVVMTAADIIANGSTTITENSYGSQDVSAPATYYTWTIGSTAFGGAKICKATAADYAGLIQMQGNASDAAKQGFFGNSSDLGKITKVVIVSKNTTYEPTEHLYMGTSAYTLNQNAQTRTTLVKDGQIYTETFEIDGDYGFFTVSNDKAGAFYVESVTVYCE